MYNESQRGIMTTETRIKELRKLRGMKQTEVANKMGISQAQYARLEQGVCDITLSQIRSLAEIFNVKPFELLSTEEQPEQLTKEEKDLLALFRKSKTPANSTTPKDQAG